MYIHCTAGFVQCANVRMYIVGFVSILKIFRKNDLHMYVMCIITCLYLFFDNCIIIMYCIRRVGFLRDRLLKVKRSLVVTPVKMQRGTMKGRGSTTRVGIKRNPSVSLNINSNKRERKKKRYIDNMCTCHVVYIHVHVCQNPIF